MSHIVKSLYVEIRRDEHDALRARVAEQAREIDGLIGVRDQLRLQASVQAQEARTQKAIVLKIGALVGCGEDWLVADAVLAALKAQPSAGVAQGIDIDAAAKALAQCMDYPWDFMPEQGREAMREHAKSVIGAARLNASAVAVPDDLYLQAINCPHSISDHEIVLRFDPKMPGHNALDQLAIRIAAAPSAQQKESGDE